MFAASKTAAAAAGTPPASTDPQFNYVTMLLHGDGTNGAQNNTFVDSSTNNFTITRNGTPTQGSFSPYGDLWSNQFKGTTDYLTVGGGMPSGQGTEFTLEFWAYSTTVGVNVFTEGPGANTLDFYVEATGTVKLDNAGVVNIFTTSAGVFPFNTWVHVALTRTTGNLYTLYINGVSVASGTNSTSYTANTTIGWQRANTSFYFKGYLSNWRVTNTRVYTSNFTPSTTPLTAVSGTSLLTCQSNRFRDNSSNNFAITVTGTPSVQRFSPFDPAAEYSTSVIGGSGFFSGASQFLTAPNNAAFDFGSGNFTIESWIFLTSNSPAEQLLFGKRANNAAYAPILAGFSKSGTVYRSFYLGSFNGSSWGLNGSFIKGTIDIPLNTWTHVAYVRNGSTFTSYVNGVADLTFTGLSSALMTNTDAVSICSSATTADSLLFGYIANTRIVKGTAVYTAAFTPPTAPLTAITNTSLLLNTVNAGIYDNAMMNDLVTVGNAQVSTSVKKYGTGSMYFDGAGDYLTLPNSQNLNFGTGNFTVEFWINPSSIPSQFNVIGTAGSFQTGSTRIGKDNTQGMAFYANNGANVVMVESSFPSSNIGNWLHYAVVRSGNNFTMYRNGVSVATGTSSLAFSLALSEGTVIGTSWDTSGQFFNGYIDDLRITKGVARYTANFTPPTAPFPNN